MSNEDYDECNEQRFDECHCLENFTDEELKNELRLRNLRKTKPLALSPDWTKLENTIKKHVESIAQYGYLQTSDKDMIYARAIETVYGQNIWNWINKVDVI